MARSSCPSRCFGGWIAFWSRPRRRCSPSMRRRKKAGLNPDPFLLRASGQSFYNTSDMDLRKLMGDQDHISQNLYAYVQGFSPAVRDIFERFSFSTQIDKLAKSGLSISSLKSSLASTCIPRPLITTKWVSPSRS